MNDLPLIRRYADCSGGIVVLCGGPGSEREVSLQSGASVYVALSRAGVPAQCVIVPETGPEQFLASLECSLAVMMLHGEFGEDGTAQTILEERGIAFTGSGAASCRMSIDKARTKQAMRDCGLPTAPWALADSAEKAEVAALAAGLDYPLFVKPNAGGSSVGAHRADDREELERAVREITESGGIALMEPLLQGREMTAGWLDGTLLPIVEMRAANGFYDYDAKYLSDATEYLCPAPLPEATARLIAEEAGKIVAVVGARDLARVDLILGENGPLFLELNALPGFTGHSLMPMAAAAAGIAMDELCLRLVTLAARRGRLADQ